jgi:hypothetical protein
VSDQELFRTVQTNLFGGLPRAQSSDAYVLYYTSGELKTFTGIPKQADRRHIQCCYVVDLRIWHLTRSSQVPALGDVYFFNVSIETDWAVTDPIAVVRANLQDAPGVIGAHLDDQLWLNIRRHSPDDAHGAEDAARSALEGQIDLPDGLSILRPRIRITTDQRLINATLERDRDRHQRNLEGDRMAGLREALQGGDEEMILLHLARNPSDTQQVLNLITSNRMRGEDLRLGLLDRLLERDLIKDADAELLRASVLGTSREQHQSRGLPPTSQREPRSVIDGNTFGGGDVPDGRTHPSTVDQDASPERTGGVKKWRSLRPTEDKPRQQ